MSRPMMPVRETRVFLAEDHFAIALALTGMLESFGCRVVARATSAASAADTARMVEADWAVLDINMGDGYCYAAAAHCRSRGIPVIFVTGYDEPPDMPADLAEVPRLLKPVEKAHLRRALRLQR